MSNYRISNASISIDNLFIFFLLFVDYRTVVSAWSSGTGGAGIIGSLSYAGLIAVGLSPTITTLLMLSVPLLEGAAFWIILRNPSNIPKNTSSDKLTSACSSVESQIDVECGNKKAGKMEPFTLMDKIRYIPQLFKYMIPIMMVYFLEYFINQGLVSGENSTSILLLTIVFH